MNQLAERFRTTLFRQALFAEFEWETYKLSWNGTPLTKDLLCGLYHELNSEYYGKETVIDSDIDHEWERIPHFYMQFYVYQYATGFSAAMAIARRILAGDPETKEGYFRFLKGGCSRTPVELLKLVGLDMEEPEVVNEAVKVFKDLLDEMEQGVKDLDTVGQLRVGTSITIGTYLLPHYVRQLKERYPSVKVEAFIGNSGCIEQRILDNEIDIGIIEGVAHSSYICSESFPGDRLAFICAADHIFAGKTLKELGEIKDQDFILREKGSAGREILTAWRHPRSWPSPHMAERQQPGHHPRCKRRAGNIHPSLFPGAGKPGPGGDG